MRERFPLITVAIPTYNRADEVGDAVESVRRQDYPNLEILISNNASLDETAEVCGRLAEKDGRIRVFNQVENIGPLPNFEFLRGQARGEFFIWLADDDRLVPGLLSRYVSFLLEHPDYVMVSGVVRYWHEGKVYLEERGFSFEQERAVDRIRAFYRKVSAGGLFHGLFRTGKAEGIGVKNILGSDWAFVSGLLMEGKVRQLDFVAYEKNLMGLSIDFERYARTVGAGRLAQANPLLAIAWYPAREFLVDDAVYGELSIWERRRLAVSAWVSLVRRLYFGMCFREPLRFVRMVFRSGIKTFVPPPVLSGVNRFRHYLLDRFLRKPTTIPGRSTPLSVPERE